MLTDDVLHYVNQSVLCWLATTGNDGFPNVSPKEIFAAYGRQSLVIANIASPGSVRNIQADPRVCVSFVDVFVQKGYKLRGSAQVVVPADARYDKMVVPLVELTQGVFPIQSIIAIEVSAVEPIIAPSYRLMPGTTEAAQIASAMRLYGVVGKSDAR